MSSPARLQLATCSYKAFREEYGHPIRTSVGAPRWRLPYKITGVLRIAAPERPMLTLELTDYEPAYRQLIERRGGVAAVVEHLLRLAAELGEARLVLLCFCDLNAEPAAPDRPVFCHRRLLATSLESYLDLRVPELTTPTARLSR